MVKKLIDNRGVNSTECQKVLGSLEELYAIADFWERQAGGVHLIATNELIEYTENETFDNKELIAFKKGLARLPLFFQECWEERQKIEQSKL